MRKSLENLVGRSASGGRRVAMRARRKFEIDRYPNEAVKGKTLTTTRRTRGNNLKTALKSVETVNVLDPNSNKTSKLAILRVTKNPANKDYERRGVISKGALVETEVGTVRVLSRPGQAGTVNAILTKH
jgi:small subunit ribosomal protein S8e